MDKIILIAGDNDFVPAAKLARISGIDFAAILKDILKQEPDIKSAWQDIGLTSKNKSIGTEETDC